MVERMNKKDGAAPSGKIGKYQGKGGRWDEREGGGGLWLK